MKTICLLLLLIATISFSHPHHHSLAVFDYNPTTHQFELSLKFLTEDYKKIIKSDDIEKYINKHLIITIDSMSLKAQFQGEEIKPEYSWLYFTFDLNCGSLKTTQFINVHNTLLLSNNPNQFNTVKLNIGNQNIVHNFSSNEKKYNFTIKDLQLLCQTR